MEYVKIDLDRWQQINDENKELKERFDAIKKGGIVISSNCWYNGVRTIITDAPIDELIKKEFDAVRMETAKADLQLEKLKQMNYFEFRKWKRENK